MNSFNSPFAQFAACALKLGYSPLPLHGKRPIFEKWDRLRFGALTPTEIEELCRKYLALNLGVAGGFRGLAPIDVDTEDREIMLAVVKALPPVKVAKTGRKGFTAFYRDATGLIEGAKFRRPNGGGFVAKLRGARERKRDSSGRVTLDGRAKCEGRKSLAERSPELIAAAHALNDGLSPQDLRSSR